MQTLKEPGLFRQKALIGGDWIAAQSGRTVEVIDPATQEVIGTVPDMGGAETRAAIEAAEAAYGPWKRRTHAERAALLEAWHGLMIDHLDDLARLLVAEGADPAVRNDAGLAAADYARRSGNQALADWIRAKATEFNARYRPGGTVRR